MCKSDETLNKDEVLIDLLGHISWCLSQYSAVLESNEETNKELQPNWSPLRTLQNNLHDFLDNTDSEQSVVIAALLIGILHKAFSDLCTDTPWDQDRAINEARKQTQIALLKLLHGYKQVLEETTIKEDELLWQGFREFENRYSRILCRINAEDIAAIKRITKAE